MTADGPLSDVSVVDFGQYVAGPAVALMLADQGARVVHVDPPGGPLWKDPANVVLNRGKKVVELDLNSERGRTQARDLIRRADVLIENFRPGVMRRLGLGAEDLTADDPALIYVSLPGFSARDEEHAGLPAWEGVISAVLGMSTDMGLNRKLRGIIPSYTPLPVASTNAAALAGVAIMAALHARERDGRGEIIEVPLALAVLESLVYSTVHIHGLPDRFRSHREREIARREEQGIPLCMSYEELGEYIDPLYENYLCSDGRPFYVCAPGHRGHAERTLRLLGVWDELVADGLPLEDPYSPSSTWADPEGGSLYAYPLSTRWADRIRPLVRRRLAQRSSEEWHRLFRERRAPGCPQMTTQEWLHSDHAIASGLVTEAEATPFGRMLHQGPHAWLESADAGASQIRLGAASERSQGTRPRPSTAAAAQTPPLTGLRFLDLTNVIAGPTITSTLTRFGAEVIKLDVIEPRFDQSCTYMFAVQCNCGKRSALVDIRQPRGREVFERLVKTADAVIFNGPDRQLPGLGLDRQSLSSIKPELVFVQFTGFGGPRPGPRSDELGFDDLAQAATGIMARFGGSLQTPEEHAHLGTVDMMAGYLGAFAALVGIHAAERRRAFTHVETSLAATAQFLQLTLMYDFEGRQPFDEPSGPEAKGEHALYRLYRASDGWIFIGLRRDQFVDLRSLPQFADLPEVAPELLGHGPTCARGQEAEKADAMLEALLGERFLERPAAEWVEILNAAGVGVAHVTSMAAVRDEYLVSEAAAPGLVTSGRPLFIRHEDHPSGHTVDMVAPNAVIYQGRRTLIPGPAPSYGAQTVEIMRELGYGDVEIEQLLVEGAVSRGEHYGDEWFPE